MTTERITHLGPMGPAAAALGLEGPIRDLWHAIGEARSGNLDGLVRRRDRAVEGAGSVLCLFVADAPPPGLAAVQAKRFAKAIQATLDRLERVGNSRGREVGDRYAVEAVVRSWIEIAADLRRAERRELRRRAKPEGGDS